MTTRRSLLRGRSPLWGLGAVLVGLLIFQIGIVVGRRQQPPSLVDRVVTILQGDYYVPLSGRRLQRRSIDAVIASLNDPYTAYLDPASLRRQRDDTAGAYSGVGIRLDPRGDGVFVAGVFPGGPAAKGGVRVGDRILAIDGTPVATALGPPAIKGVAGSKVTLTLASGNEPRRDVTLIRARVLAPAVGGDITRVGERLVGRVQLFEFTSGAGKQVGDKTRALIRAGATSLVLDLRGDRGGLVDEAVRAASTFLRRGAIIAETQGAHEPRRSLRAGGGNAATDLPLVVLVDRGSASSSEILAGALRDNGRATLVGTRTFGKAVIQVTRTLPNGGALKYTVARYRTPAGLDISARGLLPSVPTADDPSTRVDEALALARSIAANGASGSAPRLPSVTG